ncbi:phage virion morphogenesis protein (plasmid) [Rhizobium lusitanum]|uniref:phage virion morphogenesis protein n=1 Tax=Rhizobium lusitanum TaxID=293958 RepID=UPI0016143E12|nr:phage virion morphogenesis protein [Rhizobium lusitanum]QND45203.1 phage virion morphogenesis protein [Rhizobium lusitanum]
MTDKGIRLEVREDQIIAGLEKLDAANGSLSDANNAIGAYLVTSTQRRFERETGPDGKPWQRLKPRTAARRIKGRPRGYANILRVSRRLEQSIVYEADDEGIAVGTNVIYAAIQHLGGTIAMPERQQTIYQNYDAKTDTLDQTFRTRGRSNFARDVTVGAHEIKIPGRPYLGIDDADRTEIAAIIEDHYLGEDAR